MPDRYGLVLATAPLMAPAVCGAGPSLQSFTFAGQAFAFGTSPAVSARPLNASGNVLANARPRFGTTHVASTLVANSALTSLAGTATISSVSTSDTALVTYASGSFSFARGTTPVASFAPTFTMTVNVADTTETGVTGNGTISTASALTIGPFGFIPGAGTIYYGRIYLRPAYGDLRSDLYLPLEAQSYSGVGWQPMPAAGTCVTAALTSFAYSQASGLLSNGGGASNCASHVLADVTTEGGRASIRLPKPAANSVVPSAMTVTLDTGAASGLSCNTTGTTIAATSATATWLSNPDGSNPATRVAWGRARSEFLNLRERFD